MTGERGNREAVLGACYFFHYFVIQHYITWKIQNCWNSVTKNNYLFFQPEYLCNYLENGKVLCIYVYSWETLKYYFVVWSGKDRALIFFIFVWLRHGQPHPITSFNHCMSTILIQRLQGALWSCASELLFILGEVIPIGIVLG